MANLLALETSPYLLRHKDNPIHWRPWSVESLAEAERLNKPIFVSVGFAGCWPCEVMAREAFNDGDIASLLNENFICIMVDRFERPDVDALYQAAAQAMRSPGGWPLNVFLSAKAEPFGSGNFFPKEDLPEQGAMGFKTAINNVLTMLRSTDPQIANNIDALRQGLTNLWAADRRISGQLSPFALEQAARRACQLQDVFSGGVNGVPKFPNVPVLEMLWRAYQRTGAMQYSNAVETQLMQMSLSGIYDHVGGGFARFALDEFWIVPNFEKMLSDNAQMIEIMATVWQSSRQPLYKTRIEETVAWLQRVMLTPQGAFSTSVGAVTDGVEGAHVAWTAAEIDQALGADDAKIFKQVYDVREGGNWQGRSILHRLSFPQVDPVVEGRLNGMRQRLLDYRSKRMTPEIDNTILAAANGQLIRALTVAAETFNKIEWQAMAVRAFWFVADKMSTGGRLHHLMRADKTSPNDFADDYVHMAWAALGLYETTGDKRYLEKAQLWYSELDQRFWTATAGGFAMTPSDGEALFARPRIGVDGFTPGANGLAAKLSAHLYFHTSETRYRDRANEIIAVFATDALSNIAMHAGIFNALDSALRALQIVVIGDRASPDVAALRDVLRRVSLPNKILQIVPSSEALPPSHPAFGKPKVQGRATAYLCSATQCSPPIVDANQFELALKTRTTTVQMQR